MSKLMTRMSPLRALIAGLVLAAPVAQASVEGVTLTFSPGKGLKPMVDVARGTIGTGQRVATGASEVREILFPDGTSVTLAPGSDVTVEAFEYPEAGGGRLVLRVDKGLVRIAGGTLNESAPIVVKTAAGEVRLDAASAVVEVNADGRTRTNLLAGRGVELQSGGQTQRVQRPGFELVSLKGQTAPDGPVREPEGAAASDAFGLGTAQLSGLTKDGEDQLGRAGLSELAAAGAATLALATEDRLPGTVSPSTGTGSTGTGGTGTGGTGTENPGQGPGPMPPQAPPFGGFQEIDGTVGGRGSAGFSVGAGVLNSDNVSQHQPSEANGDRRSLMQSKGNATVANARSFNEPTRVRAPTTNRLFSSSDSFSQAVGATVPTLVEDKFQRDGSTLLPRPDPQLQYIFRFEGGNDTVPPGIQLDGQNQTLPLDHILEGGGGSGFSSSAPFLLQGGIDWSKTGAVVETDIVEPDYANVPNGFTSSGSIFKVASHWEILQTGFAVKPSSSVGGGTRNTMERAPDNFLLVEVRPGKLKGPKDAELDPTRPERFLFATGNVDQGRITSAGDIVRTFQNTFAVDRFFISAGLENFDQKDQSRTIASGIRAFLRDPTALGMSLSDSGLFVINTGSQSPLAQNGFLHADFGMQGTGGSQQSTISLTIGNVRYDFVPNLCTTCVTQNSAEAVASGRTIASSRGNIRPGQFGTVSISSPLMSTSFGGGNPALKRDGYAGYFVLENYTPALDADVATPLAGGTEHALGSTSSDVNYAILRLATATGQEAVGTRSTTALTGWAGGLAERENGPDRGLTIVPLGSGTDPNNFIIQTDAANNRVQADLLLLGHAPMTLGGPNNPSAMIDDKRFAAANAAVAMVNANVLRDGAGNLPTSLNLPDGQPIPKYQYLQWGFLLGDTAGKAGVDLEHLHMGTWIAGRAADQLPTIGSATYSGHAIGNVANGGALYTAVGSYDNTWNFAQRAGTVNMNFDGAQYNGTTQLTNGANFQGTMSAASRAGGVVGNFVQAPGGSPAGVAPPALAGRFVIQETAGNPYRASGTFGAERR
jgi:hypothetical protein